MGFDDGSSLNLGKSNDISFLSLREVVLEVVLDGNSVILSFLWQKAGIRGNEQ